MTGVCLSLVKFNFSGPHGIYRHYLPGPSSLCTVHLILLLLNGVALTFCVCNRHSQLVKALPCATQFALGTNPTVLPNCQPFDVQTKGSALNLYNSTTYYDDLLWAAAWMYKATGDQNYLKDAEDFYVRHLYSEQGSEKLLYNWNSYYWAANVLLVNVRVLFKQSFGSC